MINNQIRANKIMLLGEDGNKLGDFNFQDALEIAMQRELDLVQVGDNPKEQVAICKIFNYGSFLYHESKKKSKQDFANRRQDIKVINIVHGIGEKDYQIKMKKIREFIDETKKVKVIIKFSSAREALNRELTQPFIKKVVNSVEEFSALENSVSSQGIREYNFMIKPKKVYVPNNKKDEIMTEENAKPAYANKPRH